MRLLDPIYPLQVSHPQPHKHHTKIKNKKIPSLSRILFVFLSERCSSLGLNLLIVITRIELRERGGEMVSKKPRVVIIGAGMAGLTAANKLYTSAASKQLMELAVVEGGGRIGGRISTSEFCGDRIEQGATWIHGIEGSPVYKIAQETNSLHSDQPWECMDGIPEDPLTAAEGGHVLSPSLVDPISQLFKNLMNFVQAKLGETVEQCADTCGPGPGDLSVGSFLRRGLAAYLELEKDKKAAAAAVGSWSRRSLLQAVFAMHESTQRTYTSADDLCTLDYNAEKDYVLFPGEEITIARGYSRVIDYFASVLPAGVIQLGRKVERIEWRADGTGPGDRPVMLHFSDGSTMSADHVIVTVSLGVLKRGISDESPAMFDPPLPRCKAGAISRLGYGVVNKVFLQLSPFYHEKEFPFLQMVFHPSDSESRNPKIPHWIRRTSFVSPIYGSSRVVLSWFTGQEALELESMTDEEIMNGFSRTVSNLLSSHQLSETWPPRPSNSCNGSERLMFDKVLRTQWGTNPLFLGSYSYVAVGSSIDDMDTLAEPLPKGGGDSTTPPLQILFAGEATHRTHYSTTHGAYFSGLREASRLLKHYNCVGV